jgi:glycosyltransferase involved in cell wall biosynthesis
MKILHVINNLGMGGAEKLMSTLLPELKQQGFEPELICLNGEQEQAYLEPLQRAGIPVHVLSAHRSPYNPLHIRGLMAAMARIRPDLVHVHLFPAFYWVSLAFRLCGYKCPLLMTEHDTSNRRMRSAWWKPVDRFMYGPVKELICISDGVREAVQRYNPRLPARTIYNGVPLEQFTRIAPTCRNTALEQLIRRIRENPGHRIVVSVGRLVEKKDQETMLRAMAKLPPHMHLILAGEGDERPALEMLRAELALEGRVFLPGNQSDIPYLLQHADYGIITSVIEGFGLVVVEMMAAGLPVVYSRIPGLTEVAGHEALAAAPGDAEGFAAILQRLDSDPGFLTETTRACREKAEQFSIDAMARGYAAVYRGLHP